eukprot:7391474-Prymnesium_polylepis.1
MWRHAREGMWRATRAGVEGRAGGTRKGTWVRGVEGCAGGTREGRLQLPKLSLRSAFRTLTEPAGLRRLLQALTGGSRGPNLQGSAQAYDSCRGLPWTKLAGLCPGFTSAYSKLTGGVRDLRDNGCERGSLLVALSAEARDEGLDACQIGALGGVTRSH